MRVPYRHGIITHSLSGSQQNFLRFNSSNSNFVDLVAASQQFTATVAHKQSDYLVSVKVDVLKAWGPVDRNVDQYYYIDIDTVDASITYGFTPLPPTVQSQAPDHANGLHWWDPVKNEMKVSNGTTWIDVIRLFVGWSPGQQNIFRSLTTGYQQYTFGGSSVGNNNQANAGAIIFDNDERPIRRRDGTFFTTESQFFANGVDINSIRLDSVNDFAKASETVALYAIVAYSNTTEGVVGPANYNQTSSRTIGMAMQPILTGNTGPIIFQGVVQNPAWSWTTGGDKLWINASGGLTNSDPHVADPITYPTAQPPVGRVLRSDTIVFDGTGLGGTVTTVSTSGGGIETIEPDDLPVATSTEYGAVKINIDPDEGNDALVVADNDPRLSDDRAPLPHTHDAINICFDPSGRTDCFSTDNVQQALYEVCDHLRDLDPFEQVGFSLEWLTVSQFTDPDNSLSFPYKATPNASLKVDTTLQEIYIELPAFADLESAPLKDGTYIRIAPIENTYSANKLHIIPNGFTIEGAAEELTTAIDGVMLLLIFNQTKDDGAADNDWKVYYIGDHALGQFAGGFTTSIENRLDEIEASLLREIPYDLSYFVGGNHVPDVVIGSYILPREIKFNTIVTDPKSQAIAGTPADTNAITYTINYRSTDGVTSGTLGTVDFAVGDTNGVFTLNTSPEVVVPEDYVIEIVAGSTTDPAIKDVAITLVGCGAIANCDGSGADPNGIALGVLTDVTLTNPLDGEILVYDAVAGQWKNQTNVAGQGAKILNDLTDVQINGGALAPTNFLTYNGTRWVNSNPSISKLFDVTITSPTANQVLQYVGGQWQNQTLSLTTTLTGLTDTTISSPANGEVLTYNGSAWVNQTIAQSFDYTASRHIEINNNNGTSGSPFNLAEGRSYYVNTNTAAVFARLPAPVNGMVIEFKDAVGSFAKNSFTIKPNASETIGGVAGDYSVDVTDASFKLIYHNSDWKIVSDGEEVGRKFEAYRFVDVDHTSASGSPFTFAGNALLKVDTASGPAFIQLPATPYDGQTVEIVPVKNTYAANNVTIRRNTRRINNLQSDYVIATNGVVSKLVFDKVADSWFTYEEGTLAGSIGTPIVWKHVNNTYTVGSPYNSQAQDLLKVLSSGTTIGINLPANPIDGTFIRIASLDEQESATIQLKTTDGKVIRNETTTATTYDMVANKDTALVLFDSASNEWQVYINGKRVDSAVRNTTLRHPAHRCIKLAENGTAGLGFSGFHTGSYIMEDGSIQQHGWGSGYGQHHNNNVTTFMPSPFWLPNQKKAVYVANYEYSSYAIDEDGNAYSWGYNGYGQLGHGDTVHYLQAKKIQYFEDNTIQISRIEVGNTNVNAISNTAVFFLTTTGDVYVTGQNNYGQLGIGNATDSTKALTPTKITALSNITDIAYAGGGGHCLAKKNDGTWYGWGRNSNGQLGNNSTAHVRAPIVLSAIANATKALPACNNGGNGFTMALMADGTMKGAGYNAHGQLGIGNTTQQIIFQSVTPTPSSLRFSDFTVSDPHNGSVLALEVGGNMYGWGRNLHCQLGIEDTSSKTTPQAIPDQGFNGKVKFFRMFGNSDTQSSYIVTTDNKLFTAGYNGHSQLGQGDSVSTNSRTVGSRVFAQTSGFGDISVINDIRGAGYHGRVFARILLDNGDVYSCGNNDNGDSGAIERGVHRYTFTRLKMG